ncbi:hemin-degrading factor [Chimaeribacter californicus]|uniref:Hemin-degrading factor n=1 Tax=Chimaeribacter californicus TaxID=2060067 RepID=A0A2N5E7A6_9GAMM|nr:ChuX/HutX family heme-like substrate-binding protein [Chimaeribacter californicus]PLR37369.1 hemin-degrading factor [Chimaeribacter californicus]
MADLYAHYLDIKKTHPRHYARDIARLMQRSEAELLAIRTGHDARRLQLNPAALLAALETVGETLSITRNEYAVHEQRGCYQNLTLTPHGGLVLNPRALDQRLFTSQWHCAFALDEEVPQGRRHSIQIFDPQGEAVLKIYTTAQSDKVAWQALVTRFAAHDNPALTLSPVPAPVAAATDLTGLEQAWRAMTNVHQFFLLLKKYRTTRQQAFRAVPADLACRVENRALEEILAAAYQQQNEIMIFVGNRGCVQIFTGVIESVRPQHGWLNVFNPAFTLHLQHQRIAESWVTRKPTADGMVTSLELFAEDGTQIAQLYGQRTEGQPEQAIWREQLARLPVCRSGEVA